MSLGQGADGNDTTRRVVVMLPAYNEADNLEELLGSIFELRAQGVDLRVIVVDDGSTDATAKIAKRVAKDRPLTLLRNGVNRGLGETFARGMRAAIESSENEEVIVCMDADDTHRPEQIPLLLEAIDAGADVAVASRYRAGARVAGVPLYRRVLSRGLSLLFQAVRPIKGLRDYSTGYRAYRREILAKALERDGDALFDREGFGCMVALVVRLDEHGASCAEIPVDLRYDLKGGASKMHIGSAMAHNLKVLVRARVSRRRP